MEKNLDDPLERVSIETIAEELISAAHRIHSYNIAIALGQDPPDGFEKGNKDYQNKILDTVAPFIKNYQQAKNIQANSSKAVIDLLGSGKISPAEAVSLLKMLKVRMEVEEEEKIAQIKEELMKEIDGEANEKLEIEDKDDKN